MFPSARPAWRLLAALALATAVRAGALGEAGAEVQEVQESCPQAAGADTADELGFVQVTKLVESGTRRITGAGKSGNLELEKAPAAHSPALNGSSAALAAPNATENSTMAAGAREAAWPGGYGSILSLLEEKASSSDATMYVITGLVIFCIIIGLAVVARESASPPRYLEGRERQQRAPQSGARDLRSQTALARPSIQPSRTSLVQRPSAIQTSLPQQPRRSSSPCPSPRRIAAMPFTTTSMGRELKLMLTEPSIWNQFEAFFLIDAMRLPAEVGSVGDFEILSGASKDPVFYCSVASAPPTGKRVLALAAAGRLGGVLSSCAPSPGALPTLVGQGLEPCSELQIRNKDNIIWGTLSPRGIDKYFARRGREEVLEMDGDQEAGRLIVYLDGEPVAHAARGEGSDYLEVGVKPNIDPVLMLTCILAVVIFNPEEAVVTQPPSLRGLPGRY